MGSAIHPHPLGEGEIPQGNDTKRHANIVSAFF
jgi:hypothetical protein